MLSMLSLGIEEETGFQISANDFESTECGKPQGMNNPVQ